jgi:Tat protein secretion system quality control protein TatD with DNase activity
MSHQSSATSAELAAEFERVMVSLAIHPVDATIGCALEDIATETRAAQVDYLRKSDWVVADHLVRIAAIALEGAARLRRGT